MWHRREQKARKNHQCFWCRFLIGAGTVYSIVVQVAHTSVDFNHDRFHKSCLEAANSSSYSDEAWCYSGGHDTGKPCYC